VAGAVYFHWLCQVTELEKAEFLSRIILNHRMERLKITNHLNTTKLICPENIL
jgi:hypothetical protein